LRTIAETEVTALAREGARDNQRPGHRRHVSFRAVRAAWGQHL